MNAVIVLYKKHQQQLDFGAAKTSLLALLSLSICIEFFQSYVSTVLLGPVCPCQLRGLNQACLIFFKLIFGQVSSLSCFIVWLNGVSAGQGNSKILEDGIRILIFGNSQSSLYQVSCVCQPASSREMFFSSFILVLVLLATPFQTSSPTQNDFLVCFPFLSEISL